MAIITSSENHKNLAKYKDIARRLALAEGLTDDQARQLAKDGKAVVWIDRGLHATEVLGAQQLMETVHQLVSRTDEETMRFLRDVIVLAVHANPDGMGSCPISTRAIRIPSADRRRASHACIRSASGTTTPRLLYVGTARVDEHEPHPVSRVVSADHARHHHQTGPTGTIPSLPFSRSRQLRVSPLIVTGLDVVGAAMHNRFVAENKPGATMRRGANYSTWWNGGLRTTVYSTT